MRQPWLAEAGTYPGQIGLAQVLTHNTCCVDTQSPAAAKLLLSAFFSCVGEVALSASFCGLRASCLLATCWCTSFAASSPIGAAGAAVAVVTLLRLPVLLPHARCERVRALRLRAPCSQAAQHVSVQHSLAAVAMPATRIGRSWLQAPAHTKNVYTGQRHTESATPPLKHSRSNLRHGPCALQHPWQPGVAIGLSILDVGVWRGQIRWGLVSAAQRLGSNATQLHRHLSIALDTGTTTHAAAAGLCFAAWTLQRPPPCNTVALLWTCALRATSSCRGDACGPTATGRPAA